MYCKVRFASHYGHTAGLIFDHEEIQGMTIEEVSRRFPVSESLKMAKIHISPPYETEFEALHHSFEED